MGGGEDGDLLNCVHHCFALPPAVSVRSHMGLAQAAGRFLEDPAGQLQTACGVWLRTLCLHGVQKRPVPTGGEPQLVRQLWV